MDNARKKYINVEQLSSGEIFALLDNIESDEEDELDNLLNDSDTEFVTDDSIVSVPTKLDKTSASSSLLIPEASIHEPENSNEENDNGNDAIGKKKATPVQWKWKTKSSILEKKECTIEAALHADLNIQSMHFDIFTSAVGLDKRLEIIVGETNRYAIQNGRNFETTKEEIQAFLGINFVMSINQLPSIEDYWSTDRMIGNKSIQNVMSRTRFQTILQNIHFADNEKRDNSDKAFKVRPIIDHFNKVFATTMANSENQSVDEHMCKFKGKSGMKQYIKSKPIKWGIKYWYRCDSKTGYLYKLQIYQGRKTTTEFNLGESVVLELCKELKDTNCYIFFDNYFNSPNLIEKLHEQGLYGLGTVQARRKNMPEMKKDKDMKRGDQQIKYCKDIACIKWMDNKSVMLLGSNIDGIDTISTVLRREKGSATKTAVNWPKAIKVYNTYMGGVDLMDQRKAAYQLDRRSKFRFYLRLFFDLLDVACVNSYIVYEKLENKEHNLKSFKLLIASKMIGSFVSRKHAFPSSRPSKRSRQSLPGPNPPSHIPKYIDNRRRCPVCSSKGIESGPFIACSTWNVSLCIVKDRNCFAEYHM